MRAVAARLIVRDASSFENRLGITAGRGRRIPLESGSHRVNDACTARPSKYLNSRDRDIPKKRKKGGKKAASKVVGRHAFLLTFYTKPFTEERRERVVACRINVTGPR